MSSMNRRASLLLLGSAPLAAIGAARPSAPSATVPVSSREAIRTRFFPNVTLVTHEGRMVRFYDDLIKDKIVLLNFMYADCQAICSGVTMNLARVQRALGARVGRDIFLTSITLKPTHDTPSVLKEYAAMHGARSPGWTFLTGAPGDIEMLRRKLGAVDPDPVIDRDVSQHTGNVRFGNEPLQLWASCPGVVHADRIVEAIASVDWPQNGRPQRGERP
jgi:protein SCO1/2